jgi:hypothetical protein
MSAEEGIWLDRIPYEPPLVACMGCGDPLQPVEIYIKYVCGQPLHPLCRPCFDAGPAPDPSWRKAR